MSIRLALVPFLILPLSGGVFTASVVGAACLGQINGVPGSNGSFVSGSKTCDSIGLTVIEGGSIVSDSVGFHASGNGTATIGFTGITATETDTETIFFPGSGTGVYTFGYILSLQSSGAGSAWTSSASLSTSVGTGGATLTCGNFPCTDSVAVAFSIPFTYGVPLDYTITYVARGLASDGVQFSSMAVLTPEPSTATYSGVFLGILALVGRLRRVRVFSKLSSS